MTRDWFGANDPAKTHCCPIPVGTNEPEERIWEILNLNRILISVIVNGCVLTMVNRHVLLTIRLRTALFTWSESYMNDLNMFIGLKAASSV